MKYTSVTHSLSRSGIIAVAIALAAALLPMASAQAEFIGDLITIEAVSQNGSATFEVLVPDEPGTGVHWKLTGPQELRELGHNMLLGTIENMEVSLSGDPVVNIAFLATAGAVDTTFTISSAVISFPALTNPIGTASADLTLTDSTENGAAVTLLPPEVGAFQALYNGGGSTFAQLLGPQSLSSGGTLTASESAGPQTIAGAVTDIQARFHFTLSANDSATGRGTFRVENAIPEPASLLLLGMAGVGLLVGAWRKRK